MHQVNTVNTTPKFQRKRTGARCAHAILRSSSMIIDHLCISMYSALNVALSQIIALTRSRRSHGSHRHLKFQGCLSLGHQIFMCCLRQDLRVTRVSTSSHCGNCRPHVPYSRSYPSFPHFRRTFHDFPRCGWKNRPNQPLPLRCPGRSRTDPQATILKHFWMSHVPTLRDAVASVTLSLRAILQSWFKITDDFRCNGCTVTHRIFQLTLAPGFAETSCVFCKNLFKP